jgi:hypothetical protein
MGNIASLTETSSNLSSINNSSTLLNDNTFISGLETKLGPKMFDEADGYAFMDTLSKNTNFINSLASNTVILNSASNEAEKRITPILQSSSLFCDATNNFCTTPEGKEVNITGNINLTKNIGIGLPANVLPERNLHIYGSGPIGPTIKLQCDKLDGPCGRIELRQSNNTGITTWYDGSADQYKIDTFAGGSFKTTGLSMNLEGLVNVPNQLSSSTISATTKLNFPGGKWSASQDASGRLCFALSGTNIACLDGTGNIVKP